jgi:hypothetical protein
MNPESRPAVKFDPQTICAARDHQRFWRSIHGPHLICAGCHPPRAPRSVAEFIDTGPRPETMIHLVSAERGRRREGRGA